MKKSKRDLAKTQAEYEKYAWRNAINEHKNASGVA
jgi:hypothetical protein